MVTKDKTMEPPKLDVGEEGLKLGEWINSEGGKKFLQRIQNQEQVYFKNLDPNKLEILSKLSPEDVLEYHNLLEATSIMEEYAKSLRSSVESGQLSAESSVKAIDATLTLSNEIEANNAYGQLILNQVRNEQRENHRNRVKNKLRIYKRPRKADDDQTKDKPKDRDARPGIVSIRPKIKGGYTKSLTREEERKKARKIKEERDKWK